MSGQQVEYYVGMRVIAQGREGTIAKVLPSGYDVNFADGQVGYNLPSSSISPFDTAPVAKQVGGPPPPQYTATTSATSYPPQYSTGTVQNPPQYQYPTSQAYQPQQQPQPFQVQQSVPLQPHYVGAATYTGVPVVHGTITATPTPLANNSAQRGGNKLPGYEYSPDIGQPFGRLCECQGTFWMSCCCPCVVGGQVAQKLNMGSYGMVCIGYITTCVIILIIEVIVNQGFPWLILWIGWSIYVLTLRLRVKKLWQIPGDCCEDCWVTFCCLACSLAQVSKHVFGYRNIDTPPFGSDGTPLWQHRERNAHPNNAPVANVTSYQPQQVNVV